jgi:hypothetical protein
LSSFAVQSSVSPVIISNFFGSLEASASCLQCRRIWQIFLLSK